MTKRYAAAAAIVLALAAAPAAAQSGWRDIGRARISGPSGQGTITGSSPDRFRELMLCTEGGGLRINDLTLRYAAGHTQNVRLRANVAAGGCSRSFSISARGSALASLDFTYDPASIGDATVRVQIFAR